MEALLSLGVVTLFVVWLTQRNSIARASRELSELDAKLSSWTAWGYRIQRELEALRACNDANAKRIQVLEGQLAHVPTTASIPVDVNAANAAMPVIAEVSRVEAEAAQPQLDQAQPSAQPDTEPMQPSAQPTSVRTGDEARFSPTPRASAAPPAENSGWVGLRPPTIDWESLIGVRLFSWIAGVSLLLGAVFFLRYSAESGWLSPAIRMAMGLLAGIALLAVCEWKGQRYRITANAMDAAGIGTLFATSFAAHAVWHLVPVAVAMFLLVLVTSVAVLLSIRRSSLFIALLGLVGGFSTPILLSTGENRPFGLFGYLLLLNVGLAIVGYRQRWPLLTFLSVGFTTLYQWGWLARFVLDDAGQLPVAVVVFLLFPLVWLGANRFLGAKGEVGASPWVLRVLSYSSALPLMLALVMAWVPAFGERYLLLFAYLFVLDVGLLCREHFRPEDRLGLVASAMTCLVWWSWSFRAYSTDCWPLINVVLAAFVGLFLIASLASAHFGRPQSLGRFAAPVLLTMVSVLLVLEPLTASPAVPFGCLLAFLAAVAAAAIFCRDGLLYYTAVPSVLLAEVCWSAQYLDESRLFWALGIYLVFALAFIAAAMLARRLARPLEPAGLAAVVPSLNLALLLFLSLGAVASHSLWVLGVLLVVLNVGSFIEARAGRFNQAAFVTIGLSWLIVGLWWYSAIAPEQLVLALVVVLVQVLMSVGGLLFVLRTGSTNQSNSRFEQGPLLGLVGHLFLLFVASQPKLASPPWPLFAITLLLDLALVAATLYLRRAVFATAAFGATLLVLCVWAVALPAHFPSLLASEVALAAAALVVGCGEGTVWLAHRRGIDPRNIKLGRDANLLLAQGLLFAFALLPEPPRLGAMVLGQSLLLGLLMLSARASGRHGWVLAGWAGSCFSIAGWYNVHFVPGRWWELLATASVPYVLQTLYPVFCGARAKVGRWPFIAAVAGSLSFFAWGYLALRNSPLGPFLGGLPLFEAILLAGLLTYLLFIAEPAPPRDIGRLALLSAAALGFATTAIPLQLENEWLTVAWALEATAVAWLYQRLRHSGLIAASLVLAIAVAVRLSANPEVFLYHSRSSTPVWNFYLYTYGVSAVALFGASWFLRDSVEVRFPWLQKTAWVQRALSTLLLFVLLNIEIADFYSEGKVIVFRFSSTLAQDLTYTLGWALFALGMLIAGIVSKGRAARIAALVLLTLTIAKCFLHDLWRLGGLYRVGSFVGLAVCLAFVAIILQRFVLKAPANEDKS